MRTEADLAFAKSGFHNGNINTPVNRLSLQINNPQQSWGFEWEPPKAVMKDSGTRDWTLWGGKLQS
jgi:hypothetical protein